MTVHVFEDPAALAEHVTAWDDLAAGALEPNVFYESWMLRPALRAFGSDRRSVFVLVYYVHPEHTRSAPLLCGFFPLERRPRYRGLPAPSLTLWKHLHSCLCTPLLRASHAREALGAFLEWAGSDPRGAPLLELGSIAAEGPFRQLLVDFINERQTLTHVCDTFNRALLKPRESADAYLKKAISGGYRKEMRRLRNRLAETGRLESRVLKSESELDAWTRYFLELEAGGWKGRDGAGTAIALHGNQLGFFREVLCSAQRRHRLQMCGLFLDDRPIAVTINYLVADGGFHHKIAYDERLAKFSPGVQLELDLIQHVHRESRLRWLDSCATANHPMINRLWTERRTMQTMVLSSGRWRGDLVVSVLPLLRWIKRLWRGRAGVSAPGHPSAA
jgi:hypothetical protein